MKLPLSEDFCQGEFSNRIAKELAGSLFVRRTGVERRFARVRRDAKEVEMEMSLTKNSIQFR